MVARPVPRAEACRPPLYLPGYSNPWSMFYSARTHPGLERHPNVPKRTRSIGPVNHSEYVIGPPRVVNHSTWDIQIPPPKEPSPEPTLPRNTDYALPCPHCIPGNPFGWKCVPYTPRCGNFHRFFFQLSQPHPRSRNEPRPRVAFGRWRTPRSWVLRALVSPCGSWTYLPDSSDSSENLVALQAPPTSRCDFCQASFCGIAVPDRCNATSLRSQHLNGFSDLGDMVLSADIYECFEGNTVEVEIFFDYLTWHGVAPEMIYQEVCAPRVSRRMPSNLFPRLSHTFRTPLNSSHHCSTRTSSQRSTGSPGVLILTQLPLVRRSAGGVLQRSSCGVSVTGGFGRGGRAASRLPSLANLIVPAGNLVEIRRIQVRLTLPDMT